MGVWVGVSSTRFGQRRYVQESVVLFRNACAYPSLRHPKHFSFKFVLPTFVCKYVHIHLAQERLPLGPKQIPPLLDI